MNAQNHPTGSKTAAARTVCASSPGELLEAVGDAAGDELAKMFDGFFEAVEEDARLAWLASTGSRARQQDRDAAIEVRRRSETFLLRYRDAIARGMLRWRCSNGTVGNARALSLMSENELQTQLMAQGLGKELLRQVGGLQLESLQGRMANLAAAAAGVTDARQYREAPLRPEAVLDAFVSAFRSDDLSVELRSLVLQRFCKHLVPTLAFLYTRLNKRLADAGYSSQLAEPKAAPRFDAVEPLAPAPEPAAQHGWVPEGGVVEPIQRVQPGPLVAAPEPRGDDAIAESAASAQLTRIHDASPVPASAPAEAAAATGVPMRYRDIVRGRLVQWRAGVGDRFKVADSAAMLATEQLRDVACLLQAEAPPALQQALAQPGDAALALAMRDALAGGARELGLASGALRFAPDEEDAIDLVGLLFESISATRLLSEGAAALYARLVMPYLRYALVDDSLFNRRAHPARRLLDAISEVCEADADGAAATSLDFASGVVDRLLAGFREDLAVFEAAAEEFDRFQAQHRRRALLVERRASEALHGAERLQLARAGSLVEVQRILHAGPLSDAFGSFLGTQWRHALEQTMLREGGASPRWQELLALGSALAELDAAACGGACSDLPARWLALQPGVLGCCRGAGLDPAASDRLLAGMIFALAHPDTPRTAQPLPAGEDPADTVECDVPGLRLVGGTDFLQFDADTAERMRRLRVGQQLGLQDEGGREVGARVAWISPMTGRVLVVNRSGRRQLLASPEQLAALAAAGRLVLRSGHSPCDLAMRRVWQQINASDAEPVAAVA
jgi:hypothetical protein